MKKAIISLSGGMDSATLMGHMKQEGWHLMAVSFEYGSKHGPHELKAAGALCAHYGVPHGVIDLRHIFSNIQSNLLNAGPIPEGHYNDATMKLTVVPGRNHIFASILAGVAESMGCEAIALAVHAGDHHIYPDCRPEFIFALDESIRYQTEQKVRVHTPFLHLTKFDILRIGTTLQNPIPYELTRTCYKDQEFACGKCGSCRERLEAWEFMGQKDPAKYEEVAV